LREQKVIMQEVQGELAKAREELHAMTKQHPEHMRDVVSELRDGFQQKQQQYSKDLAKFEDEHTALRMKVKTQNEELNLWYPGFNHYKDSYIKTHIPATTGAHKAKIERARSQRFAKAKRMSASFVGDGQERSGSKELGGSNEHVGGVLAGLLAGEDQEEEAAEKTHSDGVPPEVAIAEDFKRLLAVLAPEKRKIIGQELVFIMNSNSQGGASPKKSARAKAKAAQAADEDIVKLKAEVQEQEERIRTLREEIFRVEADMATAREKQEGGATAEVQEEEEEDASQHNSFGGAFGLQMVAVASKKKGALKKNLREQQLQLEEDSESESQGPNSLLTSEDHGLRKSNTRSSYRSERSQ